MHAHAHAQVARLEGRAREIEAEKAAAARLEPLDAWFAEEYGKPKDRPSVKTVFDHCVKRARYAHRSLSRSHSHSL